MSALDIGRAPVAEATLVALLASLLVAAALAIPSMAALFFLSPRPRA